MCNLLMINENLQVYLNAQFWNNEHIFWKAFKIYHKEVTFSTRVEEAGIMADVVEWINLSCGLRTAHPLWLKEIK